jgi:hypothetical protein
MPSPDPNMKDIPDLAPDSDKSGDDEEPYSGDDALEDDDHLFFTAIPCEDKFICATSNISQQLAEAFHKNMVPKSFHESVPTHLHNFEDLFAKSSFD